MLGENAVESARFYRFYGEMLTMIFIVKSSSTIVTRGLSGRTYLRQVLLAKTRDVYYTLENSCHAMSA